jgi:S-DNA-T family DNA segregation ATPase FtsK/SpoIIIE
VGTYIIIASNITISLLFIFNTTVISVLSGFLKTLIAIFTRDEDEIPSTRTRPIVAEEPEEKPEVKNKIPSMMSTLKNMPKIEVEEEDDEEEQPNYLDPSEFKNVIIKSKDTKDADDKSDTVKKSPKRYSTYKLPPVDLLDTQTAKEKEKEGKQKESTEIRARVLEQTLKSFGVAASVVNISQGPAVTRYELQPEPGVKVSRIASLADDIALNLASHGVRIEAPVPGKAVVGIEVPNTVITPVRLGEIVRSPEFKRSSSKIFLGLGEDLTGNPVFGDLTKMPHLLIAGTTGSGKSVCVNSLIISTLLKARPDEVKFIMIDPKMVELSLYNDIPHLLTPVVTNAKKAAVTLKEWVTKEMDRRYKLFHDAGARNLQSYNAKVGSDGPLPYIIVVIDELADLMMASAMEVEQAICRIAQMARATGIHMIVATQRPSVDVITGLIKANIPSRISFAVATQIDSRVILDQSGAEKLLGRGDMLYNPIGAMKPVRLQGAFVSDAETEKVIAFIKDQAGPEYLDEITDLKADLGSASASEAGKDGRDSLFGDAVRVVIDSGQASTSHLQRRMRIGYNRAARIMDEIEAAGLVSKPEGENKPRKILATREMLKSVGIE